MKVLFLAVTGRLGESGDKAEDFNVIDLYLRSYKRNVIQSGIESKVLMWNGVDVPIEDSVLYERINHFGLQNVVEIVTPKKASVQDEIPNIVNKANSRIHGWSIDTINDFAYDRGDWKEFDLICSTDSDIFFTRRMKESFDRYFNFSKIFGSVFIGTPTYYRREYFIDSLGKRIRSNIGSYPSVLKDSSSENVKKYEEDRFSETDAELNGNQKMKVHFELPRIDSFYHIKSKRFWEDGNRVTWDNNYKLIKSEHAKEFSNILAESNTGISVGGDTGCITFSDVMFKFQNVRTLRISETKLPFQHYGGTFWHDNQRQNFAEWRENKLREL